MNNILLTGASGFLGKNILKTLNGITFTLGRTILNKTHIRSDLQTPPTLNQSYSTVIHNAGKAHSIPKTENEKQEFHKVNHEGTVNLLTALTPSPPKQFIFISTIAVYGLSRGENISENHELKANTPYGISKLKAEKAILNWCAKHNVTYHILRLPLIVGSNPPGNLGAIKKAIQKGYYFKIKNNTARKSMVLAEDIAKLINNLPKDRSGIYNLTDGIHPAFNDVEASIEQRVNAKSLNLPYFLVKAMAVIGDFISLLKLPTPLNSTKLDKMTSTLTFDDSKARRELDWNPKPVLPFIKEHL